VLFGIFHHGCFGLDQNSCIIAVHGFIFQYRSRHTAASIGWRHSNSYRSRHAAASIGRRYSNSHRSHVRRYMWLLWVLLLLLLVKHWFVLFAEQVLFIRRFFIVSLHVSSFYSCLSPRGIARCAWNSKENAKVTEDSDHCRRNDDDSCVVVLLLTQSVQTTQNVAGV
jgi:hypothetical protein